MKRIIGIILVVLSLYSCKSAPTFEPQIRRVLSFTFKKCKCQWYDLNNFEPKTGLVLCEDFFKEFFPDLPVKPNMLYCNNLMGFNQRAVHEYITPKGKDVLRWGDDNCW